MLIPLVGRGEAEFGIADIFEVEAAKAGNVNLRLIGSLHPLRGAFWVRKNTDMQKPWPISRERKSAWAIPRMRTIDPVVRAMLATGGLTEKDVTPVLIPELT